LDWEGKELGLELELELGDEDDKLGFVEGLPLGAIDCEGAELGP
jgi:hypothetical protein